MCVVEKDIWRYPMGEGCELRGDDMPNPYQPQQRLPWGEWEAPWDRGRDPRVDVDLQDEPERVAMWLHHVGMMLWEIERGFHGPLDITAMMPEPHWLEWALRWVEEADPGEPPPKHHHRRLEAWMRRHHGVISLLAAMLGLHHGMAYALHRALREQVVEAPEEPEGEIMWS